ncbi:MAG: ATP-binding cassette domain-containing protein, partial [Acidimicrobiales bacterium]
MSAGAPALELSGVSAAYGTYRALFDVSFVVPEGAIVALLGSNGAGTSTVARVATGLVPCTAGAVRVGGTDVTHLAAHRIARLGVAHVPEGRGVFGGLTVEENLVLALRRRVGRRAVDG